MLAIGRALMTNPDLLLMDEPSEGLAPVMVLELSHIIAQLKKNGFSILLVEQNVAMALELSDYAYVLSRGEVVYQSEPKELRDNEELKNKYLGVAK
jgi:branched-chain amino acid transport system ATP-binding protein